MKPPVKKAASTALTAGQAELLHYMTEFFMANDALPPLQVMADHFGWRSKQAAGDKVHVLTRKGYLERNALGKLRFARARFATMVVGVITTSPPCEATAKKRAPKKPKPVEA